MMHVERHCMLSMCSSDHHAHGAALQARHVQSLPDAGQCHGAMPRLVLCVHMHVCGPACKLTFGMTSMQTDMMADMHKQMFMSVHQAANCKRISSTGTLRCCPFIHSSSDIGFAPAFATRKGGRRRSSRTPPTSVGYWLGGGGALVGLPACRRLRCLPRLEDLAGVTLSSCTPTEGAAGAGSRPCHRARVRRRCMSACMHGTCGSPQVAPCCMSRTT
eukprot:364792-Chlamydomonas_euryale.AAC.19